MRLLSRVALLVLLLSAVIAVFAEGLSPARAFTTAEAAMPMRVTLEQAGGPTCVTDCVRWIAMQGKIVNETPALFRRVLSRAGRVPLPILIDSPGGSVEAALAMGRLIRSRGLPVAVAGTVVVPCTPGDEACLAVLKSGTLVATVSMAPAGCASACPLILAAGTQRFVGPGAFVGVHQIIVQRRLTKVINTFRILRRMVDGHAVEISRKLIATRPVESHVVTGKAPTVVYDEVSTYLSQMGIDPAIMPLMRSAPPSSMHWMTRSEIAATHIATTTGDAPGFSLTGTTTSSQLAVLPWLRQCCGHSPPPALPVSATAEPPRPQPASTPLPASALGGTVILTPHGAGAPQPVERGTANWFPLASPDHVAAQGGTVMMASGEVPAHKLRFSLMAGASPPGTDRDLTFEVQTITDDQGLFGPVTSLSLLPVSTPNGYIVLTAQKPETARFGSYRAIFVLPHNGSIRSEVKLELGDAAGRRATLQIPVPDSVSDAIYAVGRAMSLVRS